MAFGVRHSRALVLGASVFSLALMSSTAAFTQAAEPDAAGARRREEAEASQTQTRQAAAGSAGRSAGHERARADRRHAGAVARHDHRGRHQDRRARHRLAGAGQRGDAGADPGPAAQAPVGYLLQCAGRHLPGARRRSLDRDQHPRPAGLWPRRGGRRWRAPKLSAHRPQRQRLVLPRSRTGRQRRRGARPDRQHLRLRRDRRRGLVPHQGHPGRAAARRAVGRRHDRLLRHQQGPRVRVDFRRRARQPRCRRVRRRGLSHARQLQGRRRHRDRQHRQRDRRRRCQGHGPPGGRPRSEVRRHFPGLQIQYRPVQPRRPSRRPRNAPCSRAPRFMRPTPRTPWHVRLEVFQAGRHAVGLEFVGLRQPHR